MFEKKKLRLYLVTDPILCEEMGLENTVKAAVRGGVGVVQLRDKQASTSVLVQQGKKLKKFLSEADVPLIINDNIEAAVKIEADGVHVGQKDMNVSDVRKVVGRNMVIGLSCETKEQAVKVDPNLVDYIGVSPIFATLTKKDTEGLIGLEGIEEIVNSTVLPTVAIGGLNQKHCEQVLGKGCDGIAVVSAICGKKDPFKAARLLSSEINTYFFKHEAPLSLK
tara:strand:- start:4033 stop:4698 length:666 start_codon:yes stop_codon:yes gene_type:complete